MTEFFIKLWIGLLLIVWMIFTLALVVSILGMLVLFMEDTDWGGIGDRLVKRLTT